MPGKEKWGKSPRLGSKARASLEGIVSYDATVALEDLKTVLAEKSKNPPKTGEERQAINMKIGRYLAKLLVRISGARLSTIRVVSFMYTHPLEFPTSAPRDLSESISPFARNKGRALIYSPGNDRLEVPFELNHVRLEAEGNSKGIGDSTQAVALLRPEAMPSEFDSLFIRRSCSEIEDMMQAATTNAGAAGIRAMIDGHIRQRLIPFDGRNIDGISVTNYQVGEGVGTVEVFTQDGKSHPFDYGSTASRIL